MSIRYKVKSTSGDFNGSGAGTVKGGSAIFTGNVARKISNLSAVVNVTANTSTLTITGKWQVSNDNSTWVEARPTQNPAYVALATGTVAATGDTVIDAPPCVYGWRYVRFVVVNGVTTGGASDVWTIAYSYRQNDANQA